MVRELVGLSARELAERVRRREVSAEEVVAAHLAKIEALDGRIGAFQLVRAEKALAEARVVDAREDLATLPLAGVPVAIKDNVDVAGEPTRHGSPAVDARPAAGDDPVVARLRAAGAVVVGKTRVPELCIWGVTDGPLGTARNPWDPTRTPGGSSGGSAAAVAAGMTPIALAADGLGSTRIPAACCGLVGVKPGAGVAPVRSPPGRDQWFGMAQHGPLATTVADAALMLGILSGRDDLREVSPPATPLRVAISTASPGLGIRVDEAYVAAVRQTGELLAGAGHRVAEADPPYGTRYAAAILAHWVAGVAEDVETFGIDPSRLTRAARTHARIGRLVRRIGGARRADMQAWKEAVARLFADHDVLITPVLARPPLRADGWVGRSWPAVLDANLKYAPFAAPWNFAGYPAATVPAGVGPDGLPLAVQIVAPDGAEARVLAVAAQLETLRPWPRYAPGCV